MLAALLVAFTTALALAYFARSVLLRTPSTPTESTASGAPRNGGERIDLASAHIGVEERDTIPYWDGDGGLRFR